MHVFYLICCLMRLLLNSNEAIWSGDLLNGHLRSWGRLIVKNMTGVNVCRFEDIGFEDLVHTNIHILTLTVWHSEMKDILVLLCCSVLMVNNRFIFITVQYVYACMCMGCVSVHVCVCVLHFLLRQLLWTFEILCQLLDWAGGLLICLRYCAPWWCLALRLI